MKTSSLPRLFNYSAGALLLAAGVAMFASNGADAGFTQPHDPLLGISMSMMFCVVGTAESCVGLICLFGREMGLKLILILWLALNFLAYQLGLFWAMGPRSFNGYWGNLADAFGISSIAADLILKIVFSYLLIGGSSSLLLPWVLARTQKSSNHANDYIKIPCPSCGGKIKFSTQNVGQKIACPHCQNNITLREPEESLKMVCFFCKEHIAFPAYALGEKFPCPHCNMDITLKESA
jgi:hypothetical protein